MRRALTAFGILLMVVPGCLPTEPTPSSMDIQGGSQSMGSHDESGATGKALPTVLTPETMGQDLLQSRTYRVVDQSGGFDVFYEEMAVHSSGDFLLSLTATDFGDTGTSSFPDLLWLETYDSRGRYFVHYRDPHISDDVLVRANYDWLTLPTQKNLAGVDCDVHQLESRRGFGSFELVVDPQTKLLMGWTKFGPSGQVLAEMVTQSIDWAPDLSGVVWSQPLASEREYNPSSDPPLLGFTPLAAHYLPAGFYLMEKRYVEAQAVFGTMVPDVYFEVMGDGLRILLVAQQPLGDRTSGTQTMLFAKRVELGGVNLFEAEAYQRAIYVIGSLPMQELRAVLGGMQLTN